MVTEFNSDIGDSLNRLRMQVVLQAPFSCQDSTTTDSLIDLSNKPFSLFPLRGYLSVEEIKFGQLERSQPPEPSPRMSADGQKNEFPVAFHGGQVREFGMCPMQECRDTGQKFNIVCPFNDDQHTNLRGIFGDRVRQDLNVLICES
tara:strand:- start:162 stop:599 length:438 start_codon:yes stop_codon:yes gene_type:complete